MSWSSLSLSSSFCFLLKYQDALISFSYTFSTSLAWVNKEECLFIKFAGMKWEGLTLVKFGNTNFFRGFSVINLDNKLFKLSLRTLFWTLVVSDLCFWDPFDWVNLLCCHPWHRNKVCFCIDLPQKHALTLNVNCR